MFPNLKFLYPLMIALGIVVAILIVFIFFKVKKLPKGWFIEFLICTSFSIFTAFIFAVLMQNLYNLSFYGSDYKWTWSLTFFGGLAGGVLGFLLAYKLFLRHDKKIRLDDMWIIAPPAICIGHCLGRMGCFFEGCCYGIASESGIFLPAVGYKVVPTQLYEAVLLLILGIFLLIFAFKEDLKFNAPIYLLVYAIGRFVIEMYRGDYRGPQIGPFSPSQVWCFAVLIFAIPFIFYLKDNKNEAKTDY